MSLSFTLYMALVLEQQTLSGAATAEGSALLPREWGPPMVGLSVACCFETCEHVYTRSHRRVGAARYLG